MSPKNKKHSSTAPRSRTGVKRRTGRRLSLRKQGKRLNQDETANAAIFADSIFTITLPTKVGTEVFCKLFGSDPIMKRSILQGDSYEINLDEMHANLFEALSAAYKCLRPGVSISCNAKTQHDKLDFVLQGFKELLPESYEFNIERNENTGKFCFVIYKECDFPYQHSAFEVYPTIKKLERNSSSILDLFIIFIKAFTEITDVCGWWQLLDHTIDMYEEQIEYQDDLTEEEIVQRVAHLAPYKNGKAAYYREKIIRETQLYSIDEIEDMISYKRQNHPIIKLIKEGCALLRDSYSFDEFDYQPVPDEELHSYPMRLYLQVGVAWRFDDEIFSEFESYLDANAQEGIQEPIVSFIVNEHTTEIDFEALERKSKYPRRLTDFIHYANDQNEKYERSYRKADKTLLSILGTDSVHE